MNQHHMYIKSHALCTLMHILVETVDVADRRSCLFFTSYISVMSKDDNSLPVISCVAGAKCCLSYSSSFSIFQQ
jgi:hypothetical protein